MCVEVRRKFYRVGSLHPSFHMIQGPSQAIMFGGHWSLPTKSSYWPLLEVLRQKNTVLELEMVEIISKSILLLTN